MPLCIMLPCPAAGSIAPRGIMPATPARFLVAVPRPFLAPARPACRPSPSSRRPFRMGGMPSAHAQASAPDCRPKSQCQAVEPFPSRRTYAIRLPAGFAHVALMPLSGWIGPALRPPRSMDGHYKIGCRLGNRGVRNFSCLRHKNQLDSRPSHGGLPISRFDSNRFSNRA